MFFCGDTLFSAGCGRLFDGTALQLHNSLQRIKALPRDLTIYCAHEYTQSNCAFALNVEPGNPALQARSLEIDGLREKDKITLPSSIGDELAANPFLRTRERSVIEAARKINPEASAGVSTMAVIRSWKDSF